MSEPFRHHRASQPSPTVLLVPVPVAAGQDFGRKQYPPPYPKPQRDQWSKCQDIPASLQRQKEVLLQQARELARKCQEIADAQACINPSRAVCAGRIVLAG